MKCKICGSDNAKLVFDPYIKEHYANYMIHDKEMLCNECVLTIRYDNED